MATINVQRFSGDNLGPNILQASVHEMQMRTKKVLIIEHDNLLNMLPD